MGTIRFRARLSRALTTIALGVLLALGGALTSPPDPATAAALSASVPDDEAPTDVDTIDDDSTAGLRMPIGLLSVGVLVVAVGGLLLEVRRRRTAPTPASHD